MCLKTAQNKLSFLAGRPRIWLFCNILYFTRGAALSPAQGAWLNRSQRHGVYFGQGFNKTMLGGAKLPLFI